LIDPVALRLGPLTIHWYGILMGTAFALGTFLAYRQTKKEGYDPEHILNLLMFIVPSAIIGARLYYVLFELHRYTDNIWKVFAVWEGGLAIHGGLIGGTIAGVWYVRKNHLPVLKMADIIAPSVIIGQAIGRWGNFINQEAHGGPVSETFISKFPEFIQKQMFIQGQYVHPTFLYESVWNIIVFFILIFSRTKKKFDGQIAMMYLALYSVGRFFIEGLRTDSLMIGPLRTAQLVSLLLIVVAVAGMVYLSRRQHKLSK
jgi:phosphatidylglycerol:prolipoprotein diacylglycerol transferase